ncbi:MAG: hypothetical protein Tsb0016_12440 [Sphingomonadales bacterium]
MKKLFKGIKKAVKIARVVATIANPEAFLIEKLIAGAILVKNAADGIKAAVSNPATLDGIQAGLDASSIALDASGAGIIVSFIPDLANAAISLLRGDFTGAGLSTLAAVPIVGTVANAARLGRRANEAAVVREFVTEADQVFFRVFSDNPTGGFLTAVRPRSRAFAQEALALPSSNGATLIQEVVVPKGTKLRRSRAAPLFGRRGGAEQFQLLDELPANRFRPGVPFQ